MKGCAKGCLQLALLGVLGVILMGVVASLNRANLPVPPEGRPGESRRVPNPGPMTGDLERIFEAAREQRESPGESERGDAGDVARIKAVYAAEGLGVPARVVPTTDWPDGFRYIVVTAGRAAHVAYLTADGAVASVRHVYDADGTPQGLAFLYRKPQ